MDAGALDRLSALVCTLEEDKAEITVDAATVTFSGHQAELWFSADLGGHSARILPPAAPADPP